MAAKTGLFGMGTVGTVAAVVIGLGAVGFGAREGIRRLQPPEISLEVPENAAVAPNSAVTTAAPAPDAAAPEEPDATVAETGPETPPAPALTPPGFDVVRVDPDGTSVVAGTAMPGSEVVLYLDGARFEATGAGPAGKFALFLFFEPSQKPRLLSLLSRLDGQEVWAEDQIILSPTPTPTPDPVPEEETVAEAAPQEEQATQADPAPETVAEVAEAEPIARVAAALDDAVTERDTAADEPLAHAVDPDPAPPAVEDPVEDTVVATAEPETSEPIAEVASEIETDPLRETEEVAALAVTEAPEVDATLDPVTPVETSVAEAVQTAIEEITETLSGDAPETGDAPAALATPSDAPAQAPDAPAPESAAPTIVADLPAAPVPSGPVSPPGPDKLPAPLPEQAAVPVETDAPATARAPAAPEPEPAAPVVVADLPATPVPEPPARQPEPNAEPAPRPDSNVTPVVPDAPAAPTAPATQARDFESAPAAPTDTSGVTIIRAGADGVELLQPGTPVRPDALDRLALDTISYSEAGEVQLSGRAPDGTAVRVYLDNTAVADLAIGSDGRWKGELGGVRPGVYTLRLDQVSADGSVGGRLETPFKREAPAILEAARADVPPDAPSISIVTVQRGDTLWAISQQNYGAGFMYVRVFDANRDAIRDPDLIYPGQIFSVPN